MIKGRIADKSEYLIPQYIFRKLTDNSKKIISLFTNFSPKRTANVFL